MMRRKSIFGFAPQRQNNLVAVLSSLVVFLSLIQSNNVVQGQALINQLAALFRSRSPWPTTFPSGTTTGTGGESGGTLTEPGSFSDMITSQIGKDLRLEDFSHFNDLLTGQSINQLNLGEQDLGVSGGNTNSNAGESGSDGFSSLQLPILATSHPLPQLEMQHGNGKSVLIAHPVLGPNPNEPPEKVEHKFNGMVMTNPLSSQINKNAGLYNNNGNNHQQQDGHNQQAPRPSAVRYPNNNERLKNSFQNFAQKLFYPNKNNNIANKQPHYQKVMIPMIGKPPVGGKIIAIPVPVPSNSPLLKNFHGGGGGGRRPTPQIIAVRQPFPPITSVPSQPYQQQEQHVTSFLGKFSPSPLDMSTSYAQATNFSFTERESSGNGTTAAFSPPTTLAMSSSVAATTPSPPIYQSHRYVGEQISSGSSHEYSSTTLVTTPAPTTTITTTTPITTTTTSRPPYKNIQDVILNSSQQQNSLHSSPSTLVGSFRYPDPPTPPKMLNMNTRYELKQSESEDTQKSQWIPQPSLSQKKAAYFSAEKNVNNNNNANGFLLSSSAPISLTPRGSRSKWRHDDDNSNSASVPAFSKFNGHNSGDSGFKPSLQLHSFEDTTSGLREFITINPLSNRNSKSLFPTTTSRSTGSNENVDLPAMESGFRPFNHFAFSNGISSASVSSTTESSMMNMLRNEFTKDIVTANVWSDMDPTKSSKPYSSSPGIRQNRQFFSNSGYANTKPFYAPAPASTSITVGASYSNGGGGYNYNRNDMHKPTQTGSDWVGRFGSNFQFPPFTTEPSHYSGDHHAASTTAASSSLVSEWLVPTTKRKKENKDHHKDASGKSEANSFSISASSSSSLERFKSPPDCEKFHRFGFCPVTSYYPLGKVEAVGARCSTLLSHLIAPLPKTDVRYDVIVTKNSTSSSSSKGKGSSSSAKNTAGWSWKTFSGKPVCDTKEVKIVPGWAKNEQGQWLIILQTQEWKQEAQISLCAHNSHPSRDDDMKCVQRFTAQRLVVLDPQNEERCPVVRSVFLPSACVCLNDEEKHGKQKKSKNRHHKKSSHNSTTKSGGDKSSTSSLSNSKTISGRSLLTSLFGLDLDPASSEVVPVPPTSSSIEASQEDSRSDNAKSEEEEEAKNPLTPSNSPFMVIANEGESETWAESGEELRSSSPNKRSVLGSSFILSSRNSSRINGTIRPDSDSSSQRNGN